MNLPRSQNAIVEKRKLLEYLLSPTHPVGRFKAAFFAQLGYFPEDWERLRDDLVAIATSGEAQLAETTPYGRKYLVDGILTSSDGNAVPVITVWILHETDDTPRLVTVYPR